MLYRKILEIVARTEPVIDRLNEDIIYIEQPVRPAISRRKSTSLIEVSAWAT